MTSFAHVNIAATDWKTLTQFYIDVFHCSPVLPERDMNGKWLADAIGVPGAHLRGMHLRLPGHGENDPGNTGPTLEIFQYDEMTGRPEMQANTPGLTHICFRVDDVAATSEQFLARGGQAVGPLTVKEVPGAGTLTFQYLRDPEGNIVEIQRWG